MGETESFFSTLVENISKFVKLDEDKLKMNRLDIGCVLILTPWENKIEQVVEARFGDLSIKIRIVEVECVQIQNLEAPSLSENHDEPAIEEDSVRGDSLSENHDDSNWSESKDEDDDVEAKLNMFSAKGTG
ncbi:unnamed protein product [Lupinus luteus]|uniref:Uncharacterized protein n=1 Tax=Lupinus luteus TaxID=3873 RepID=A0AAV1YC18_LUPLU